MRTGRPPALTPDKQKEVQLRLAAGEKVARLAAEYKVGRATIMRLSAFSGKVRQVAETLASAHAALAELPPAQQHQALTLAEKLRAISDSVAAAAVSGADTAKTLHAIANTKARSAAKAIAAGKDEEATDDLRAVAVLTKIGNDAAAVPLGLIASSKGRDTDPPPPPPMIDPKALSQQALAELLAARDAAAALAR